MDHGKTTLLNCISTIDRVTAGKIIIDGKDITKLNPFKGFPGKIFSNECDLIRISRDLRVEAKRLSGVELSRLLDVRLIGLLGCLAVKFL